MIQKIIDGIIKAIRTKYDRSYRIYTESIEQGLIEPCFSVLCLNPSGEREISDRFKRFYPFMITYFPSSDEPVAECNEVCEVLLDVLNDIDTNVDVLHGTDLSGKVVDGNLQFSVQYNIFVRKVDEMAAEGMDGLAVDTAAVIQKGWFNVANKTETVLFTKEQFLKSKTYGQHRDLLSAVLNDKMTYSKEQVDKIIKNFYGKAGT